MAQCPFSIGDFLNFTPHDVVIKESGTGAVFRIPSAGVIRLGSAFEPTLVEWVGGIPITNPPSFTKLEGPVDHFMAAKCAIVSSMVGEFVATHGIRMRVYSPSTVVAYQVRDEKGNMAGVMSLVRHA